MFFFIGVFKEILRSYIFFHYTNIYKLPLLDEMVDTFMSRDSDSRIIARELHAVRQWLTGDKIYHIMRDHPSHCRVILGGIY
jgi:hypothetical protein